MIRRPSDRRLHAHSRLRHSVDAAGAAGTQARQAGPGWRDAARRLRSAADPSRRRPDRRRSHRSRRSCRGDHDSAGLPGDRHERPHHDAGHDRAPRAPDHPGARQLRHVVSLDRQAGARHARQGDGNLGAAVAECRHHVSRRPRRAARRKPEHPRSNQEGRDSRSAHVDERPVDHARGRRHDGSIRRHRGHEQRAGRRARSSGSRRRVWTSSRRTRG